MYLLFTQSIVKLDKKRYYYIGAIFAKGFTAIAKLNKTNINNYRTLYEKSAQITKL
jgi:hypothetical protein